MTIATAKISACGTYRYYLSRPPRIMAPTKAAALFCLLNPSTADASINDPTVMRMWGFADSWGCNGFIVVNLYAFRSKDPSDLWVHADPVGPENDHTIGLLAAQHPLVICGWGVNARFDRVKEVCRIFKKARADLFCLRVTKDGFPSHPLYIPANQPLTPYGL